MKPKNKPKPLWRKQNKRSLSSLYNVYHLSKHYRWDRNTKHKGKNDPRVKTPMNSQKLGVDYKPLYKFLAKNTGRPWNDVHSEVCKRLPHEHRDAIWHIVYKNVYVEDGYLYHRDGEYPAVGQCRPTHRVGEASYADTLFICPDTGLLKKVKVSGYKNDKPEDKKHAPPV